MSYVRSIVRYGHGLADKFRGTLMQGLAQAAAEAITQIEDRLIELRRMEADHEARIKALEDA